LCTWIDGSIYAADSRWRIRSDAVFIDGRICCFPVGGLAFIAEKRGCRPLRLSLRAGPRHPRKRGLDDKALSPGDESADCRRPVAVVVPGWRGNFASGCGCICSSEVGTSEDAAFR